MSKGTGLRFGSCPPEPVVHVTALEIYFGVTLPETLKEIYAVGDEAHIGPIRTLSDPDLHFDFHAVRAPHFEYVGESVIGSHKWIMEVRPDLAKLVPIGAPGNGDQVCLDYRKGSEPSVVMLDHEILTVESEPTHPLAESFDDLIVRAYSSS